MDKNNFSKFHLSKGILEALTMLKYIEPNEIQKEVIPVILNGQDVVVKAKTGSGKTAAFAVPICEKVDWLENHPQALVLEPTRELAEQVREEIFLIGRKKRIKVPALFGGFPIEKQILTIKQKSHVVVGTPGRILDHLKRGSLQVDKIKYLVIDEADHMLGMGFLEDLEIIMGYLPTKRINLLFSATLDSQARGLTEKYLNNPRMIVLEDDTETVAAIEEVGYMVESEDKVQLLLDVLVTESPKYCMIFCDTREMVQVVYRQVKQVGIKCQMLHGLLDQKERLKIISDFRDKRFPYLICTDVAARGVDFDGITHVINYDIPTNKENYVHRVGRTGRNGKSGKAISFIQEKENRVLRAIEEYIGVQVAILDRPSRQDIDEKKEAFYKEQKKKVVIQERRGAIFKRDIMSIRISGGKKSKIRTCNIVATICQIPGMTAEDIGIIDIRDSLTYVEIQNGKGKQVLEALPEMTIKGKMRNIRKAR